MNQKWLLAILRVHFNKTASLKKTFRTPWNKLKKMLFTAMLWSSVEKVLLIQAGQYQFINQQLIKQHANKKMGRMTSISPVYKATFYIPVIETNPKQPPGIVVVTHKILQKKFIKQQVVRLWVYKCLFCHCSNNNKEKHLLKDQRNVIIGVAYVSREHQRNKRYLFRCFFSKQFNRPTTY